MLKRVLVVIQCGLLLVACGQQFQRPRLPATEFAGFEQAQLKQWCMKGRVAVRHQQQGWQSGLSWCRDDERSSLRFVGLLGQEVLAIEQQPGWIRIQEGDDLLISYQPERMLNERLGFSVPLTALRYWLVGVPEMRAAGVALSKLDKNTSGFVQHGWEIKYLRFAEVEGLRMPTKIKLARAGLNLKIIIDQWHIGESIDRESM